MSRAFPFAAVLLLLLVACGTSDVPTFSTDLAGFNVPEAVDDAIPVGSEVDQREIAELDGDAPTNPEVVPVDVAAPDLVAQDPAAEIPPADLPPAEATPTDVAPIDDIAQGPEADIVLPDCEPGNVRSVACGLNGAGAQPQACVNGAWADQGPCLDPDLCLNGNTQTHSCGLNGRGTQVDGCAGGQPQPGPCQDPDECKDGTSQPVACPGGAGGTKANSCVNGHWTVVGSCTQQGRWACQNNTCKPQFGAAGCGDGTCEPLNGESKTSCPADCDHSGTSGQDQPCSSALDCAQYGWPAGVIGYWECAGWPWSKACNAVQDQTYCGTPGQDYCYMDTQYLETPQSCPSDCPAKTLNCGSAMECMFQPWPLQ